MKLNFNGRIGDGDVIPYVRMNSLRSANRRDRGKRLYDLDLSRHLGHRRVSQENFKKDLKSSIEKKISNFIFLTAFHLVYKFGYKSKGVRFFNDLQGKTTNLISRLVFEKLQ